MSRVSKPLLTFTSDMASMQQQQHQQQQAMSRHNSYTGEPARHASLSSTASRMSVHRTLSNVSSSDLVMAEAPSQTPPPRVVTVPSLSEADRRAVHELEAYLAKNSYAYDSHVHLINLLHQGFVAHVYNAAGEAVREPRQYNLLSDLRQAREAMDSRFAVGEDIWKDWIQDESLIAKTGEERMSVMELCQKAVSEEPSSVALWLLYGEYVMQTFSVANGQAEGDPNQWTDEDKEICKEVFTREVVLDVWERAVRGTEWRIDESSKIWDRYIDWILAEFPDQPTPSQVDQVNGMFMARLAIPHATWTETSQKFWPIVSKYNVNTWEEIMAATNEMAGPAKRQFGLREEHELQISRASESGDKTALYAAFNEYLNWEVKNERKGRVASFNFEVRSCLFERALLRFPTVIDWWLDYADFLVTTKPHSPAILPMLERATRHCPWSGELWSKRILRSEVEKRPYEEVGNVKHKATNSGLLDIGGMEEVLKVYAAWCSYLRRRAFDPENTDDEVDMADMGITGTLEDAGVAGKKIYGDEFKGDPLYRLEKIHIKFLTEARRINDARGVWQRLVASQSHSSDFWIAYHSWELLVWAHERLNDGVRLETPENAPHRASAVIRQALSQRNLDWPEKIADLYASHFRHHETAEAVQKAEVEVRTARYYTQIRRAKEAEEAAATAAAAAPTADVPTSATTLTPIPEEAPVSNNKRKRDDGVQQNGEDAIKRNKTDDANPAFEPSSSASAQIKRDREHNTITIKDLPKDTDEKRVRQFFMDCGEVLSVNISKEDTDMNAYATVEFADHEGVLAAKTRDGKEIVEGHPIRIQSGTLSTLYVTNYPADYDEVKLRELFQGVSSRSHCSFPPEYTDTSQFGTIVSVRFPSLKYSAKRRFCYMQFLTAEEARAATSMNDKALDAQHRLTALISDPDAKKSRSGATSEGRELHVSNVDWNTTESEIKEHFSEFGTVQSIRMLRSSAGRFAGKFTGTCFVIFSKPEEATAALALNNKPLKSRLLRVVIATDKSSAANQGATTLIRNSAASAEPEEGLSPGSTAPQDRRGSASSIAPGAAGAVAPSELNDETAHTKFERTVAILGLPDTVNDARIQAHMSKYGPLRKIVMKREKNGALVEFVNLQDAGKVGMGIDCSALGPDVHVGEASSIAGRSKPKSAAVVPAFAAPPTGMRPLQAGASRPKQAGSGRRGGLGFKRGGGFSTARSTEGKGGAKAEEDGEKVKKGNNADFRALFEKSREGAGAKSENVNEEA